MTIRSLSRWLALTTLICLGAPRSPAQTPAPAAPVVTARYLAADGVEPSLAALLRRVNREHGTALSPADFVTGEDRELAYSRYQRHDQIVSGVPARRMAVRIWSTRATKGPGGRLIQAEVRVQAPALAPEMELLVAADTPDRAARDLDHALRLLAARGDTRILDQSHTLVYAEGRLAREVVIKTRRGTHTCLYSPADGALLKHDFRPRASGERLTTGDESVPALVYPIYEEYQGTLLERRPVWLRHLSPRRRLADADPYEPLRGRVYPTSLLDPALAETPAGQAAGYWSPAGLARQAAALAAEVPFTDNRLGTGNTLLTGRYVTVSIHPEALTAFPAAHLPPRYLTPLIYKWSPLAGAADPDEWQVIPMAPLAGLPLAHRDAAWERDATRHPDHDPATYINSGFDEVQVYWAVNALFDTLRPLGFTDPELAERPFQAVLFDPDIESRDNAYYDADTINFATYSPGELNYARDNTTIWHELGHGLMDRLMGSRLALADTGGLSEGMADFVAELMLRATVGEAAFPGKDAQRIINRTGFHLTNEEHDDGEAYGGVMKAILDAAIAGHGRRGLAMTADLVLEAMRLSRDHPELTAEEWFERMRLADALGRPGLRAPGAMAAAVSASLAARNFAPPSRRATMDLRHGEQPVDAGAPGSRYNAIPLDLDAAATATREVTVTVTDGDPYRFNWPVEVRVFYNSGPLQGGIDWVGEDTEPHVYTLAASGGSVTVPLTVRGQCDHATSDDGSCTDYAYIQVYGRGDSLPAAKKRFYLQVK